MATLRTIKSEMLMVTKELKCSSLRIKLPNSIFPARCLTLSVFFFSSLFVLRANRLHARWTSDDARHGDAASNANADADVLRVQPSIAINDAAAIPMILRAVATNIAIHLSRNYKPNELPTLKSLAMGLIAFALCTVVSQMAFVVREIT